MLEAAGHTVVAVAGDGDTVRLLTSEPADAAILDIRMPPGDTGGIVTGQGCAAHPDLGLLFLSLYADVHYLMRILDIDRDDAQPQPPPPGACGPAWATGSKTGWAMWACWATTCTASSPGRS